MKKVIFTLVFLFSVTLMVSQTEISGTVKDNSGVPVAGANILIQGSSFGATSDFDGNFSFMANLAGSQKLKVSYLGYKTFEQAINLDKSKISIQIVLQESENVLDEIVLTSSSTFRSQKQTPMSISSIKQEGIARLSANSQADIIRSFPGLTAEGGGGETASNIFVRGLPSGGQYVFTPLQYDGMPLISVFGLNSSAHDVYARPDIGFVGAEFVRGGAAILYGAGSVAGILNYTSKTGDANPGNIISTEWADRGRMKVDFYSGGQLGGEDSNTYYAFTGFMRYDDGPYETGLPTKGVQFRGNIKKVFDKGSFTLHGQFIDDKVQFLMPLPLEGGSRKRLKGNDGKDVYQLMSGELANTSFLTPGGVYESPIEDGVYTKGGYLLADFKYNFNDDLKFKSKIKYASYKHSFALYVGGNGANGGNPISLSGYVNTLFPGNQGYTASYQGDTEPMNSNNLVIDNLHIDRIRPLTDYSGEASLTKTIYTDKGSHNITAGTYIARSEAEDINYQYRVLSEFNNNPRIINLSYINSNGENVIYSQGGLSNRIGMTANKFLSQSRTAFYLTDEMVFEKWRFDVGFRVESTEGTFSNGNITSQTVYDNPDLTPELSDVRFADGSFTRANVSASDWAVSFAGLYELNEDVNLYANFSKGFFFPQIRGFAPIASGVTGAKYNAEKIVQFETGAKYGNDKLSGSLAVYYITLADRIRIKQGYVDGALVDKTRTEQSTRTFGLEATWNYKLSNNMSLIGSLTLQDHKLTANLDEDLINGGITEVNVGNKMVRQPNILGNLGLYYDNSTFDANFSLNHSGKKFTSDINNIELDAIDIVRFGTGYTMDLGQNSETLRLGFSIFNLFNSEGITEGNPRDVAEVEEEFFFGRPILPRRFFLTATFNF